MGIGVGVGVAVGAGVGLGTGDGKGVGVAVGVGVGFGFGPRLLLCAGTLAIRNMLIIKLSDRFMPAIMDQSSPLKWSLASCAIGVPADTAARATVSFAWRRCWFFRFRFSRLGCVLTGADLI